MRTKRTLKHWGNDSAHLCSPNVTSTNAVDELTLLVKNEFPDYLQIHFFERDNGGLRTHKSKGCDKLYVYAWYWNGSWSDPSKELVSVLYKPKLSVYSKFDNEALNYFRTRGGSSLSVLKDLVRIKHHEEVIMYHFGLLRWVDFISSLSRKDRDIILLIETEWNWNIEVD